MIDIDLEVEQQYWLEQQRRIMDMMEFLRVHTSLNALSDQEIMHFLASLEAAGAEIVVRERIAHEPSPPALEAEEVPDDHA